MTVLMSEPEVVVVRVVPDFLYTVGQDVRLHKISIDHKR